MLMFVLFYVFFLFVFFFFKQKTAYEMRISDWSSDVCSSDLGRARDADTYVAHVPDDRVMFAPSIRWQPTPDTDVVLTGLYQEADTGSPSSFQPIIVIFRPHTVAGEQPARSPLVAKPGWARMPGRSPSCAGSVPPSFHATC